MTIGVYGLGRFGSFFSGELAKVHRVLGCNRSPVASAPPGVQLVSRKELLSCDTIILCVAISSFREVLQSFVGQLKPGTLVMDTCSVKMYPAQVMQELLPESIDIIATHPMFGPDSGSTGIAGLPLVFHPIRCSAERAHQVKHLFTALQLQVLEMSCEQHDREAAYSQGVTHFVGRVLDALHLSDTAIATVGYKQLLSIVEQTCNDPLQLFYDLQRYNPYTYEMRSQLTRAIDDVLKVLAKQDDEVKELSSS
jgi:prephenate dehydrogenase